MSQQTGIGKSLIWSAPVVLGVLVLVGCSQDKAKETALLDSQSLESYAATEGTGEQGSAQALVEVIPTPSAAEGIVATAGAAPLAPAAVSAPAAKPAAIPTGNLSYEQRIQAALTKAGLYSGAIDGKIGPKTREAIKAFQQQEGLKADGVVGAMTWERLRKYLSGTQTPAPTAAPAAADGSDLPSASAPAEAY